MEFLPAGDIEGLHPVKGLEHVISLVSEVDFNCSCDFSVVIAYQNVDVRHLCSFQTLYGPRIQPDYYKQSG